eukprot:CAMPEP_0197302802 /NCGR_PEP_ID=MMETSP0890-20130614/51278_1 /TAXON_ID=44058 ORGANISM="Aureoumbra lagunensis, Strain CCMP1510" /NCGR_SAMPLE_ID=MMETSP0890 /ASSEMBLY_ACC=CAM_ASM_000533 /LENGTH=552 /DNA_ID=CAMNT_0042782501 /DNA_START=9 /DNA_END=1667 /DNA_ORIENTATION=-
MAAAPTKLVNPGSEVVTRAQSLLVNAGAARGLQSILKSNLGPRGTLKMLVGGAGQIKLTKDGAVLLKEMQIQHPTAMLIARTATAQDEITGDGTTSVVLLVGELLKVAERYVSEGLHPRVIADGYDAARDHAIEVLESSKIQLSDDDMSRDLLMAVARTALSTKLQSSIAEVMTESVVDAVKTVQPCSLGPQQNIDLHMVEIMTMEHKLAADSTFVRGLVLDHASRHPDMPKSLQNCKILTCNVSLEFEKSEVAAGFYYSSADQREKLVESERKFTDDKVKQLIEFKRKVCGPDDSFVVINQKGIDPLSLDMLAKEGIFAARRAKRRNMERIALCCGGAAVNSFDDLDESCLGYAGKVYEMNLGEENYTFIDQVKHPKSCTILIKGPNKHTIDQIKDAVRDGLRAVAAVLEDKAIIPGAGAFEIAAATSLEHTLKRHATGKKKFGIQAYADALLIIPKTLAENSGLDVQETIVQLQDAHLASPDGKTLIGLDLHSGTPTDPKLLGVYDGYRTKKQFLHLSTVLATQLLLVDEVIKAGKKMGKPSPDDALDMD